ncbi:MAG TPA: enoyl-CoA hydratase-related protein [Acidimicrobiales bacterium]|nr:enoyl-CoA hydratase-related protein [Acidimicrobiales bacterium]
MSGVRADVADGIAVVTLDRPDRLNAFDLEMVQNLLSKLETLAADDSVRVVVLTGAGRGFCAGGDLSQVATGRSVEVPLAAQVERVRGLARVAELLRDMPKPSIAAVNGPCAGAGMSLACAADLRYAARSAIFTTAFARVGQSGDYGLGWTLGRLLGGARARELLLLGERLDAQDAFRFGLVSRILEDAELLTFVRQVAATLTAMAPLTLAAIKANLSDGERLSFSDYLDQEAERFVYTSRTADALEAVLAFQEKRAPRFIGA